MSTEFLLKQFELLADLPDAIDRFRQFIMTLGVTGKLTSADAADEPTLGLAKKIEKKKSDLRKKGVLREKALLPIQEQVVLPLRLPSHWMWMRLCDIGKLSGGMTPSMLRSDFWGGDVLWLSPKDIKSDSVSDSELRLTALGVSETRLELYPPGSLFIVARSGILKRTLPVSINRVPATANQDMKVLVPFLEGQERYLQIMFRGLTPFILRTLVKTGTTVQSLRYAEFEQQLFPVPPLAEQHRIVAKVDELMALCDQLEAARAEREKVRDRLTASTLARLSSADVEISGTDSRLALEALPMMTARADQLASLHQVILNLAVRGKLVPQESSALSGATLADQITTERRASWENRQLAQFQGAGRKPPMGWKDKYLVPSREVGRFELPFNWTWLSALEACECIESGSTPASTEMVNGAGEIPFIKVYNLTKNGSLDFSIKPTFISRAIHNSKLARSRILPGDVLMNIVGPPLGKISLVPDSFPEWNTNQAVVLFRPSKMLLPRYLTICLLSSAVLTWLTDSAQKTVGQLNISVSKSRRLPIPVPPLAEQQRIVMKVDELSKLCSSLGDALTTAADTRRQLLDALLAEALAPDVLNEADVEHTL